MSDKLIEKLTITVERSETGAFFVSSRELPGAMTFNRDLPTALRAFVEGAEGIWRACQSKDTPQRAAFSRWFGEDTQA